MNATFIITTLALLFFALLLVVKASFAVRHRKLDAKPARMLSSDNLRGGRGLFREQQDESARQITAEVETKALEQRRRDLLARAHAGDVAVLREALNLNCYDEALALLTSYAFYSNDVIKRSEYDLIERPMDEAFKLMCEFASFITSHELRTNANFIEKFGALWHRQPSEKTLSIMLHLAALAGDAKVYARALELACDVRRKGNLPRMETKDFVALCESQYWLLDANARASGEGFALKHALEEIRIESLQVSHVERERK